MTERDSRSRLWLAVASAAAVAGGLGLALGWWLHGTDAHSGSSASAPESHSADSVTREELEAAKREILAQLQLLALPQAASTSPAAAPGSDQVFELCRRLDEIGARVALLGVGNRAGVSGRAWANLRGPGSESIEKICARIRERHEQEQRNENTEGPELLDVLLKEHHLWTIEDVFRAYGPPEHITNEDGFSAYYGRFTMEAVDLPCFVFFRVREGFVTEIGYDCREDW
jgi:hypothetical protein